MKIKLYYIKLKAARQLQENKLAIEHWRVRRWKHVSATKLDPEAILLSRLSAADFPGLDLPQYNVTLAGFCSRKGETWILLLILTSRKYIEIENVYTQAQCV